MILAPVDYSSVSANVVILHLSRKRSELGFNITSRYDNDPLLHVMVREVAAVLIKAGSVCVLIELSKHLSGS